MKSARMLGVNPDFKRETNDFYATDPNAIEVALPTLQRIGLQRNVWECACCQGHIAKVLQDKGYRVKSSDLINRGFGEVQDFLTCTEKFNGDILTNPPFKSAVAFVRHGMTLLEERAKMFLFLKVQFLESRARKELFRVHPPKVVAVYSERQKCAMNGDFKTYCKNANTQCFAWFVFEKGFCGTPQITWI